jgi:hypothetical protein
MLVGLLGVFGMALPAGLARDSVLRVSVVSRVLAGWVHGVGGADGLPAVPAVHVRP